MDYDKIMAKARKTNRKRDKDEKEVGFATPYDGPLSQQVRTAMAAIECGIKIDDWDCVAEGQAILEVIELMIRHTEKSNR